MTDIVGLFSSLVKALLSETSMFFGMSEVDKGRMLLDAALNHLPVSELHSHLDDVARARADKAASIAEAAKFGQ